MNRPDFVTDKHLKFLDELSESRITNMFDMLSYLRNKFPELTKDEPRDTLQYWMFSYNERHSK